MEVINLDTLSLVIIFLLSLMAYKMQFLTFTASFVAYIIAVCIFYAFYWNGMILIGLFFVTSSLLSKWKNKHKKKTEDVLVKGDFRDSLQVLANGGFPFLISIGDLIFPEYAPWEWLFAVSIACANADTWASEIGTLSRKKPRMLWTLKKVETGTSGAITLLGTIAALSGSFFVSIFSYLLFEQSIEMVLLIIIFGFIGNLLDTFLGASVQANYQCQKCGKTTEKLVHCQYSTQKVKGISFMNNDVVNLLSIGISTFLFYLFIY